jgi:hypothetical protein
MARITRSPAASIIKTVYNVLLSIFAERQHRARTGGRGKRREHPR